MNKPKYNLSFLPIFQEDLYEVTDYITNALKNPSAAHRLLDDIEFAISKRLEMPLSFPKYQSSKKKTSLLQNQCKKLLDFLCGNRQYNGSEKIIICKEKY